MGMPESDSSGETNHLVEHFFRHEYANLVAVLTRAFGIARIDLVEDMVGSAMMQAMNSWKQRGIPDNPAGWIHKVARNRILDALRREKTHEKSLAFVGLLRNPIGVDGAVSPENLLNQWLDEQALPDSLLRMMFVCCHPELDRKSQIALTLKILCGFSIREIARGLLISAEAAKKRIQRAKSYLAANRVAIEFPSSSELQERLTVVHDVLYLMFNEGYSTSQGDRPVRDDVCEEAARLCHLLCEHKTLSTSESRALLSLMLFHASRLPARTDDFGNIVLLEEQDREKWDRSLMRVADRWLVRSVNEQPSRFHFEAVIAQYHCTAGSVKETDWKMIVKFYDRLMDLHPSPVYRLNRAIALGQSGDFKAAFRELESIRNLAEMKDYFLLDCALGHLHELAGSVALATDAYLAALSNSMADHQKAAIESRLKKLGGGQAETDS